ncbi:hypothetical protein RF11_08470 [Thelohanellus kitauei]|uniref:Uncharacterized protein n=1 Tax=Thelohanellus kitauei TaxID=669202 RepID=A0A0C2IWN5_THEKT|nr:hypothetical protein RF11_08470 [Thelohanellus kitauei]
MMITANSRIHCLCSLLLFIIHTQKTVVVDDTQLNVVVVGDIGLPERKSFIKTKVVRAICAQNEQVPFHLGINLGGNAYYNGLRKNEFAVLEWAISQSFPKAIFPFDFLTELGKVDYDGDVDTELNYYVRYDNRFYLPNKNYFYDVTLSDGTSIRFICIDSTQLYETNPLESDIRELQIQDTITLLDNSGFLTAIFNAYNHNMQWHSRWLIRPPVISVGNSALNDPVTASRTPNSWCLSPTDGGYGQLSVTKQFAIFKFIDSDGTILREEKIYPVDKSIFV